MNSKPTFNFVQSVFTLNMFANLVSDKKLPDSQLQSDLSQMLTTILANPDVQQLMGSWEVVWGPVIGSYGSDANPANPNKQVVSNALYVAKNTVTGQYVIATSATNPVSKYGWFVEDFDVRTMVPWGTNILGGVEAPPDAPRISSGTDTGLNHLLSLQSGAEGIIAYLTSVFFNEKEKVELVVTGHSLGGAMSSVLALYIDEAQKSWNPSGSVILTAMPTAGASPGNKAFSDYHNNIMGTRTIRFWNKLDPVPHGWQPDLVEQVPYLYYPFLKPGVLFQGLVALVLEQGYQGTKPYPKGGPYTQLMPQVSPLPGQINIVTAANPSAASVLQLLVDFGAEDLLKKLNITGITATLIIDAINVFLKDFVGQETIDQFMDALRAKLAQLPAKEEWIEKRFMLLQTIIGEVENVFLFLLQLVYQHVTSYTYLMGTSAMHPLSQAIINNMVIEGHLDTGYTNVVEQQSDPQFIVEQMSPMIGSALLNLLTPAFLEKNGWDKLLA